jgi:glycosyltransferase involved in cell wall biosynthesis
MLTITYLITVYNKACYIAKVIESLKQVKGDFHKEFIFINDGSTDNSLEIIKEKTANLPNVQIITHQNKGPSISTNVGINASGGDYIHFIDGDDLVSPDSTTLLLHAINSFNCQVAYGIRGTYDNDTFELSPIQLATDTLYIQDPLKGILQRKISLIRCIGSSGSLVKTKLLKKIGGCDESVFIQDMSLSLACSLHTKFARVNKSLSYCPKRYGKNNISSNSKFEKYQSLLAMMNFFEKNREVCQNYGVYFFKAFWSTIWKMDKNIMILPYYLISKIDFRKKSWGYLIKLFKTHLDRLKYVNTR